MAGQVDLVLVDVVMKVNGRKKVKKSPLFFTKGFSMELCCICEVNALVKG